MAKQIKHKDIGIPANHPEQFCKDKKCPWHGKLPVRGKIFVGHVKSAKAYKTAVVISEFIKKIPKYERYMRSHSRIVAYNPECIGAKQGDKVKIAECRPLSKTKSFVVVEVLK